MVFKKLLSLFILCVVISIQLSSQEILQKAETGYSKIYLNSASSSTAFDYNGNLYPTNSYSEFSTFLFVKYGFSDNLTISLDAPLYKKFEYGKQKSSGIGDPVISFFLGLNPQSRFNFILSATMLLPIGESGQFDNPIPVGWEEYQTQIKLIIHYSLPKLPISVSAYSGGAFRGNNKNNDLIFGASSEWRVFESLKFSALIDNRFPIGKIRSTPPELNGAANGLGFIYFTTGLSYSIVSMDFSYSFRTQIYAQNVASARLNTFGIGFYF